MMEKKEGHEDMKDRGTEECVVGFNFRPFL